MGSSVPRLHGKSADAAEVTSAVARRCSARIRFLCFKSNNFEELIQTYDEKAADMCSKWRQTPSTQPSNTLLTFPVTKSGQSNHATSKRPLGLVRPTDQQRYELLERLAHILQQPYEEARAAHMASNTSFTSESDLRRVVDASEKTIDTALTKADNTLLNRSDVQAKVVPEAELCAEQVTIPKRRGVADSEVQQTPSKKQRPSIVYKQMYLPEMFGTTLQAKQVTETIQVTRQSFGTTCSTPPDQIFSQRTQPDALSSTDVSMVDNIDKASQNYFPTQDTEDFLSDPMLVRSLDDNDDPFGHETPITSFAKQLNNLPTLFENHWKIANLSFEITYELQSLALSWNLSISELYHDAVAFSKDCISEQDKEILCHAW